MAKRLVCLDSLLVKDTKSEKACGSKSEIKTTRKKKKKRRKEEKKREEKW